MFEGLHLNRLQRKVLLVIALIVLVPMLVTGMLSASWISSRTDHSIEAWIRESALVDKTTIEEFHHNARFFSDSLQEMSHGQPLLQAGHSPIPHKLRPLARELGISLVQLYDANGTLLYSSLPVTLASNWTHGQDTAVVKVLRNGHKLLAAITVIHLTHGRYRLVLGGLFDKVLLKRLSHLSGLKTQLFYLHNGGFTKAFPEAGEPLELHLPASAYQRLKHQQDYYSAKAGGDHYWGLYTPISDASGQVEAVLFSGLAHSGGPRLLTDRTVLTLVILLLGTLLSIATGYFISRLVVRPVKYLHQGVMQVAAQDFRAKVPILTKDELGDLARAFNAMAESLHEARDEQRREFQRDKILALGELSLAMAHEIRNPIGIINTASSLLENAKDEGKSAELRRVIREESLRLDQLLNDFQQLARHRQPEFTDIDPAQPLEKALQAMLAGHDEISINRHYTHGPRIVRGDRELLQQSWINLVRNALESMVSGTSHLEAGSYVQSDGITVYLHDSGPGITLEQLPRLFEPFYTTKQQGSGLGLTIANTLADANGARLELVHGDWKGARFAMHFPLPTAEET